MTTREPFGTLPDGSPVERLRLQGTDGFAVAVTTYGAAIQSILAPDAAGHLADIVLGHDDFDAYHATRGFFGATIGRYANRIAGGRFTLAGREHRIAPNDGANALHGGADGFDRQVFSVREASATRLVLQRTSPDGEEGFPGALCVSVTYEVEGTSLSVLLEAETTAETTVNLTNHSFFNLAGSGSATRHELSVEADAFLPVGADGIPEGGLAPVAGTPFDFREATAIEARLRADDARLRATRGYDHNYVLRGGRTSEPRPVATLRDPASGRTLVLHTTEPGLQVYSGNFLDGSARGKGGLAIRQGDGICLEPQAFPDAPNRPDFPSARLLPGERYHHAIRMEFSARSPQ